ncbi:hypothetical protein N9M52_00790 [bacterium]|nr:hypothetical protein [bacterium]
MYLIDRVERENTMSYEAVDYSSPEVFVDYMMSFYSNRPDSVYPELDFDEDEVYKALATRLTRKKYELPFEGDSVDREIVRDIVLEDRMNLFRKGLL